jgi:hypothetical protein
MIVNFSATRYFALLKVSRRTYFGSGLFKRTNIQVLKWTLTIDTCHEKLYKWGLFRQSHFYEVARVAPLYLFIYLHSFFWEAYQS